MKKDIISKILWKIQIIATTKLTELFLWIVVSGCIFVFLTKYLSYNNIIQPYFSIFLAFFIYYACYKIILD